MKKIFKSLIIISLFLINTNAEVNVTEGIKGLVEKKRQEKDIVTGKTTDEWFEKYKEEMSFDRQEWEEKKKKFYKNAQKRGEKRYPHKSKKYRELYANFSGAFMIYESFKDEKGKSYILEDSEQREEIKQYLEELKKEYENADKKYTEYLREGGK